MRNRRIVALEKVLVDTALIVKHFESCFESLRVLVNAASIEAFKVDAAEGEHCSWIAAFREEQVFIKESEQIDLLV